MGPNLSLTEAMTLSYYKNIEQLLSNQSKRLDIIKRLKQKAPIHQSFKIQLQKEIHEYYKNVTHLKQKLARPPMNPIAQNQLQHQGQLSRP